MHVKITLTQNQSDDGVFENASEDIDEDRKG